MPPARKPRKRTCNTFRAGCSAHSDCGPSWAGCSPKTTTVSRARIHTPCSPRTTDRKSTRLNSSHLGISYAVFCLKKKKTKYNTHIDAPNPHIHPKLLTHYNLA